MKCEHRQIGPEIWGLNIKIFISMCAERGETTVKIDSGGLAQPLSIIRKSHLVVVLNG